LLDDSPPDASSIKRLSTKSEKRRKSAGGLDGETVGEEGIYGDAVPP